MGQVLIQNLDLPLNLPFWFRRSCNKYSTNMEGFCIRDHPITRTFLYVFLVFFSISRWIIFEKDFDKKLYREEYICNFEPEDDHYEMLT